MSQKVIVKTFDILETIKKYSSKYKVDLKNVGFSITDISYIHKTKLSNKIIKKESILGIKSRQDDVNQIQQKFNIKLFRKDKAKFIISHRVFINKDKTEAFSVVSPKSKVRYYDNLEKDLIEYFNEEKAKRKMLVSFFDDDMIRDISLFVEYVKTNNNRLPKNTKICIASKANYIASVENNLSYNYLPKNMGKNDLVNCYCFVKAKQQVILYTQGSKGKSGLDICGNYMKAKDIRVKEDLSFNVSKNLEIINDDDTQSQVIAKIDGVLVFKNEEFDIKSILSFSSLDFKAVRYFNVPLDIEDVVINIKSRREFENAINSGVILKAHNINIQGDIDAGVTIVAVNLSCDGNIHRSAILRAKNAKLKILKGKLKAENATIKTMENGLVIGDSVEVVRSVGGEFRAREIKINFLHSNNIIKCSKTLEIGIMKGDNNDIHMSMNADMELKADIKRYKEELLNVKEIEPRNVPIIKRKYAEHKKKAQILEAQIGDTSKNPKEIQKRILLNQNILNALKGDIDALKHKHNLISNLKKIDELLYQTKIILKNGWNGDNIVMYDYIHKKENIRATPKKLIKYISLVNNDNKDTIKLT